MAGPGCELNICCYRTRADCRGGDGSSLCMALLASDILQQIVAVWGVITHDCVELFDLFIFFLLQAQGLLLVICDCNPRRLKKLSKDTKNIILGENNMLNYEQGEIVFIFFFEYTTSLILKAQRVPLVLFFNIKRVKAKPSLFHFHIAGFIFRFNCPG